MASKSKSKSKAPKQSWHCGKCGAKGHNARTCKGKGKAKK